MSTFEILTVIFAVLTVIFTGVISLIAVITFIRGIPTKEDFNRLVDRFDRHLEYHSQTKTNELSK